MPPPTPVPRISPITKGYCVNSSSRASGQGKMVLASLSRRTSRSSRALRCRSATLYRHIRAAQRQFSLPASPGMLIPTILAAPLSASANSSQLRRLKRHHSWHEAWEPVPTVAAPSRSTATQLLFRHVKPAWHHRSCFIYSAITGRSILRRVNTLLARRAGYQRSPVA